MLITRPMRLGPGGLRQGDHPDRHDHPAGEALQHAEADQRLGAPRQAAQAARHDERGHRGHPHPPRAEALGGPAGQRDRGGEREQVAGAHPLDRRQRRAQLDPQRLQRDVDDRRVEDRHDRADRSRRRRCGGRRGEGPRPSGLGRDGLAGARRVRRAPVAPCAWVMAAIATRCGVQNAVPLTTRVSRS